MALRSLPQGYALYGGAVGTVAAGAFHWGVQTLAIGTALEAGVLTGSALKAIADTAMYGPGECQ